VYSPESSLTYNDDGGGDCGGGGCGGDGGGGGGVGGGSGGSGGGGGGGGSGGGDGGGDGNGGSSGAAAAVVTAAGRKGERDRKIKWDEGNEQRTSWDVSTLDTASEATYHDGSEDMRRLDVARSGDGRIRKKVYG
jgi:hypothetical protein